MNRPLLATLTLTTVLLGACGPQPSPPPANPFSYQINTALKPSPETLGSKPLGVVQDEAGRKSLFITNEILVRPTNQAELDAFVARVGGTVLGNDGVPDPPAGSGIQMDPKYKQPTLYRVKLDPSSVDLSSFKSNTEKIGLGGKVSISSEAAAKLLALVNRERVGGLKTSPNFVAEGQSPLFASEEHPDGAGFMNALGFPEFSTGGSKASVGAAWQWIAAKGGFTPVEIAVIDGGFWLDSTGRPMSSLTPAVSDFPALPVQYDFAGGDYIADGVSLARCTGGSVCNWHGNGAAGVAAGAMNNRYGLAGTGGQVATPMLFKTDLSWDQTAGAVRTAVAWGADVISMSFGAECDNVFCDGYFEFNIFPALRNARDNNVVMVAAAGNDNLSTNSVPCKAGGEGVICVGALADDTNTAIGYSNFGPHVDIWAPTNIRTLPDGETTPNLKEFGGTSASTPFVAGIAAMLKAYNLSLSSPQVLDILRRTAWTDSPDSKVTHYVNAFRALREVSGSELTADSLEANNTAAAASPLTIGTSTFRRNDLTLHTLADRDHLRFTLSDYVQLSLDAEFIPALGNIALSVIREGGTFGSPEGVTNELRSDGRGRSYRASVLPPGTYRVALSSDSPNLYNLVIGQIPITLSPDRFEANNTLATATGLPAPGFGSYNLNLHTLTDSDHFFFNPSSASPTSFRVNITARDMPLTLRLFDNTNAEVSNVVCSGATCSLNIPNGIHRVKVEGNGSTRGRYTLQATYQIDRNALLPDFKLFPTEPINWLDPGDPAIPGWLVGLQDVLAFKEVGKAKKGILIGNGLKITLLDKTGKVLVQGTPSTNPQLPGAEVALNGLTLNETYVLLIERLNLPSSIDGESESLGAVPYTIDLGN